MKYAKIALCILLPFTGVAQKADTVHQAFLDKIFSYSLRHGEAYNYLTALCDSIGPRLSGSEGAAQAVDYTAHLMENLGFSKVLKREVVVPNWKRGETEKGYFTNAQGDAVRMRVTALGGSVGTNGTLSAPVIEVQNFGDLERLGRDQINGKIVFFNRPMNPVHVSTFTAYGGGVNQRWAGAMEAAKYGATGVLVRSLTLRLDTLPHTGSMGYADSIQQIPAAAISTVDAEALSKAIKEGETTARYTLSCYTLPDTLSHNVLGELKGSEHPLKYIAVGGHLDSWDLGTGAHDDGAGCVQSIEALRILKALGYTPKHTLRAVMFMNEENGLRGAKAYAQRAAEIPEEHVMAVETDAGGFVPRGFRIDGTPEQVALAKSFRMYLEDYGIYSFKEGGSGADVGQLKNGKVMLAGLSPDSQRYFDYHHASSDNLEAVNPRELQLGAAALAAFIYLVDVQLSE